VQENQADEMMEVTFNQSPDRFEKYLTFSPLNEYFHPNLTSPISAARVVTILTNSLTKLFEWDYSIC
jgi:hypothetical protein